MIFHNLSKYETNKGNERCELGREIPFVFLLALIQVRVGGGGGVVG